MAKSYIKVFHFVNEIEKISPVLISKNIQKRAQGGRNRTKSSSPAERYRCKSANDKNLKLTLLVPFKQFQSLGNLELCSLFLFLKLA